jgi:hypothetical protein
VRNYVERNGIDESDLRMNRNPKKKKTTTIPSLPITEQSHVCEEKEHTNWSTFLTIESPTYCAKNFKNGLYNKPCDGAGCSRIFTGDKINDDNKDSAFRPTTKKPIYECRNKCGYSICFYCRESIRNSEIEEIKNNEV